MNIVYVRQSPDWKSMDRDKFFSQKFDYSQEYWETVLKTIWVFIKQWDRRCGVPYFQYRSELKEIASKSISKINADIVTEEKRLDGEFVFVPVDDDDWLHPHLFDVIRRCLLPDTDVVIWNHSILNHDGSVSLLDNSVLYSNNFAITNSGVDKLRSGEEFDFGQRTPHWSNHPVDLPFSRSPFEPHYDINRRVTKTEFATRESLGSFPNEFNILRIDDRLGISNKTMASANVLMRMNKLKINERLQNLHNQLEVFDWAKDLAEDLESLNLRTQAQTLRMF